MEGNEHQWITKIQQEGNYRNVWKETLSREEIYWKQRSRELWLKEVDRSTMFFIDHLQSTEGETLLIALETTIM